MIVTAHFRSVVRVVESLLIMMWKRPKWGGKLYMKCMRIYLRGGAGRSEVTRDGHRPWSWLERPAVCRKITVGSLWGSRGFQSQGAAGRGGSRREPGKGALARPDFAGLVFLSSSRNLPAVKAKKEV